MFTRRLHQGLGHLIQYEVVTATFSGIVGDDCRYGQNYGLGYCAIAPSYVVDQKTMYATITVLKRMNVDKAESGSRTAHDRRLFFCELKEQLGIAQWAI